MAYFLKDIFNFYYAQSHSFKGDWPDTFEEFKLKCEKDTIFYGYWHKRFEMHKTEQERAKLKVSTK